MKIRLATLMSSAALLAACGGGGGSGEGEFTISDGVLSGIELPSDAELAAFPADLQGLIADFRDINENGTVATNVPGSGTLSYAGSLGFTVEDGDDVVAIIAGDLTMTADWDNPFGDLVTGTVTNLSGEDAEGNPITLLNNLNIDAPINGGEMDGTIQGNLSLSGEVYQVNGGFDGSFEGDGATRALGETQGTITNPDTTQDLFFGIWFAD